MPYFVYKSLSASGQEEHGRIDANNEAEALATLKSQGFFVMSISLERTVQKGDITFDGVRAFFDPVRRKHIPVFFRQLSVLLDSGVRLVCALSLLEDQSPTYGMRRMLRAVRQNVEAGNSLSKSFEAYPSTFSSYVISMTKAAELSGEMEITMNRIAKQLEASAQARQQLLTGLLYPTFILISVIAVMGFLSLKVIPTFQPLLGTGQELPWTTQAIMDISYWVQVNWLYLLGGVAAVVLGLIVLYKTRSGKFYMDSNLLHAPIIAKIIRYSIVVNFSQNLAMLIASGVPLIEALEAMRSALRNGAAIAVLENMMKHILEGESMSSALEHHTHIFPNIVYTMVRTGEESGNMVRVLELTAGMYKNMLETSIKRLNAMMEPFFTVVLGGLVGFVVYALVAGMLAVYGV